MPQFSHRVNILSANKDVNMLGRNYFSFRYFEAWLLSSPTCTLHFVYQVVFKESLASLVFCLSYKATLFKLKKVSLKSCLVL